MSPFRRVPGALPLQKRALFRALLTVRPRAEAAGEKTGCLNLLIPTSSSSPVLSSGLWGLGEVEFLCSVSQIFEV